MSSLEYHDPQLESEFSEEAELRLHFSHLFPRVNFDSILKAGVWSKLRFHYDIFLEGALLEQFKSAATTGHFSVERLNVARPDDLHLFHHVIAVEPISTKPVVPKAVLAKIRPEERMGGVGCEYFADFELRVVGLSAKHTTTGQEIPSAFIWYSHSLITTPNRTREA